MGIGKMRLRWFGEKRLVLRGIVMLVDGKEVWFDEGFGWSVEGEKGMSEEEKRRWRVRIGVVLLDYVELVEEDL